MLSSDVKHNGRFIGNYIQASIRFPNSGGQETNDPGTQPWPLKIPKRWVGHVETTLESKGHVTPALPTRSPTQNCQDDDIISIFFGVCELSPWLHFSTQKKNTTQHHPGFRCVVWTSLGVGNLPRSHPPPQDFMDGRHLKLKGNTEAV